MKIKEILKNINFETVFLEDENAEVETGYSCDLLSEVIGRAKADSIWITVHTNLNVLAVATMIDIPAVVISEGHNVDDDFVSRAKKEGISVFRTDEDSYTVAGKLYEIGVK